jgi:hypothetical protein
MRKKACTATAAPTATIKLPMLQPLYAIEHTPTGAAPRLLQPLCMDDFATVLAFRTEAEAIVCLLNRVHYHGYQRDSLRVVEMRAAGGK